MDKNNQGFTFIELVIVTGIILLFSGLGLAQYNSYSEHSRLKTETNKLKDTLELAKKKTITREIMNGCDYAFEGYSVTIAFASYTLKFRCNGNKTNIQTFSLISLTPNISVQSGTGDVDFSAPPTMLSADKTIAVKNASLPAASQCLSITIKTTGALTVSDTPSTCP